MTVDELTAWRLRCRVCQVTSGGLTWVKLLGLRGGPSCSSCGAKEVTAQEPASGAAVVFPRPLAPLGELWRCCNCGGTGLDAYGDTCPHCAGLGHCQ
ncbi:hypothetical protein SAMN04489712_104354 [Thermomonospora echinospora]|uniref:Uncharacterized protein n=1 Tax=Thermomonospora echinospora TaxID=1992 RepID=A0A1H5Z5T2_9ACTN|nr:hypothetical protein [Thermomonospora echinospora]SEG31370.1 hypothetical protein SAMN04489712_104354 [Thermomonospora echinospora]